MNDDTKQILIDILEILKTSGNDVEKELDNTDDKLMRALLGMKLLGITDSLFLVASYVKNLGSKL